MDLIDFLPGDTNSGKLKISLIIFWVGVVKSEHCLLVHGTLKSSVSKKIIYEHSWFFACWYKLRKAKSSFINYLDWHGQKKWSGTILEIEGSVRQRYKRGLFTKKILKRAPLT